MSNSHGPIGSFHAMVIEKENMFKSKRPIVNYHGSVWGDYFIKYDSIGSKKNDDAIGVENKVHGDLLEKLREKIILSKDKLNMIDAIQRLGIGYRFQNEIEDVIQSEVVSCSECVNDDLRTCALRFQLLRGHGYNISENIFKKFINNEGEFNEVIKSDIKGMLGLYEATHLRLHGEDLLEKALVFTTSQFEAILHDNLISNPYLIKQVTHAMDQPFHKGLARIMSRKYMSLYEGDKTHDKTLLKFAKLDFNILQKMHQRELGELTRWWKDLDLANKFPFARDRLVEAYLWGLGIYFEPQYAHGRNIITKTITFLSIMDDMYDAYGTYEELDVFTNTMISWERNGCRELQNYISQLPEYMKYYYQQLDDHYKWLEKESMDRNILYGVQHAKHMMRVMANAYMNEARWLHESYIPNLEEYMSVARTTAGSHIICVLFFLGMQPNLATNDAFEWIQNWPDIVQAMNVIVRLADDIVDFKEEPKREHVTSAIKCYMNEYGVEEDLAIHELRKQINDGWKDVNSEIMRPTKFPIDLLKRAINIARFVEMMYKGEDSYTNPQSKAKDYITSILVNCVDM